jgi:hypothetical protein
MKLAKVGAQRLKILWFEDYGLHAASSHLAVRGMQQRFQVAL